MSVKKYINFDKCLYIIRYYTHIQIANTQLYEKNTSQISINKQKKPNNNKKKHGHTKIIFHPAGYSTTTFQQVPDN